MWFNLRVHLLRWTLRKLVARPSGTFIAWRDEVIYFDWFGRMWKIRQTGQHDQPLMITLEKQ